jgi:hypothetical protein
VDAFPKDYYSTHAQNMHKYMNLKLNCWIVTMYCNKIYLEEYFTRKYAQTKLDESIYVSLTGHKFSVS